MVDALALLSAPPHPEAEPMDGKHLRIVVGAAQGFSGSYSERIVAGAVSDAPSTEFLLIGQRCISEFESRRCPARS